MFRNLKTFFIVQVMVSFKIDKQLQTISNYFLFSLAVADLIIGAFSVPLFAVMYIERSWPFSRSVVTTSDQLVATHRLILA